MKILRLAALFLLAAFPARAETDIQTITTPGGVTAWLVEDHQIPFTALELRFQGGTSLDLPGKRGAVNLMTALIEEGTGDLDSQGFAKARDTLAASFEFDSDSDSVTVSARFLTENRDAAVDLLRQAITAPRFDQDAIDRVKGQVLANLRASEKDPGDIANRAFDATAFGDHPYATDGSGTADSVTALTRDDILAAHKGAMARDRVTVAAAGDITPEDLAKVIDTLLAGLPETGLPQPGAATIGLKGGITVQDYPGPQSVILFGAPGIAFEDPDYFAASVLNEIVGGGRFSARLMNEVREKRGLTYGIGTALAGYDHADLIVGQLSSDNTKTAEAIQVIRDQWAEIAANGVTPEELETAKTYMTGAYPLRFDGNGRIASILVGMQSLGLPADYPKTRNDRINAVTLDDVNRVAKRLMNPDTLTFVVVGQPQNLPNP